jgi:hypothetical protein
MGLFVWVCDDGSVGLGVGVVMRLFIQLSGWMYGWGGTVIPAAILTISA